MYVSDLERAKGDTRGSSSIHLNGAEMMYFTLASVDILQDLIVDKFDPVWLCWKAHVVRIMLYVVGRAGRDGTKRDGTKLGRAGRRGTVGLARNDGTHAENLRRSSASCYGDRLTVVTQHNSILLFSLSTLLSRQCPNGTALKSLNSTFLLISRQLSSHMARSARSGTYIYTYTYVYVHIYKYLPHHHICKCTHV